MRSRNAGVKLRVLLVLSGCFWLFICTMQIHGTDKRMISLSKISNNALAEEDTTWDDSLYPVSDVTDADLDEEQRILDSGALPEYIPWLLAVAEGEIGYREGAQSYTKYGEWAGEPNAEWCAEFVCWCVDQVDQQYGTNLLTNSYPKYSGQNTGRDWFIERGRFVYRRGNCPGWGYQWLWGKQELMKKNDYIPYPGDWMFFSYNEAGDTEHVAMVEYCTQDALGEVIVHVIEGNNPSSVQRNSYRLNNSQVLGFGTSMTSVGTTMRNGNRGDSVRQLQENLHELGYLDAQHITGSYGGNTKRAVSDLQQQIEGKSVNGIADMQTQYAIRSALAMKEFTDPESWIVED